MVIGVASSPARGDAAAMLPTPHTASDATLTATAVPTTRPRRLKWRLLFIIDLGTFEGCGNYCPSNVSCQLELPLTVPW